MRYICGYCYRAKFLCNFVAPCDDRIQEMREQAKDPEAEETEAPNSEVLPESTRPHAPDASTPPPAESLDKQPCLGKTFFYLLLRDHLPAGTVEGLVSDVEAQGGRAPVYSNEFLAGYAAELSARIAR